MALQNQEIGDRIRELRGRRPQTSVAKAINVGERTYQTWEGGEAKPSYRSLERLAEFFGVTESYILDGIDERPIIEGVPEQLGEVDEKFSELVASVQDQLNRLEEKVDRLMDLVDAGLFSQPGAAKDDPRRHPPTLREDQTPLVAGLVEALQELRPPEAPPQTAAG